MSADEASVRVFVRVRPLSAQEISRDSVTCLAVDSINRSITIERRQPRSGTTSPTSLAKTTSSSTTEEELAKRFVFDDCFEVSAPVISNNSAVQSEDQQEVFNMVALPLLQHALHGFNVCIFAYGQTGSGKSHTMIGCRQSKGIIPRSCGWLFDQIAHPPTNGAMYKVQVSYLEIYCEKVRDLLNPGNKSNLRVREHPSLGPYVEDLSKLIVTSFAEINNLITVGNKSRTVASTNMNETSSRSHAVFQLILTQIRKEPETGMLLKKMSRISFVDLAGSERAMNAGSTGQRLKEGANINKSLTTLGKVIGALAERSNKRKRDIFVPYRDSILTWLLKDCIGGNSKTSMISCVSPSHLNYEETLSTLRYSDRAKCIINIAVVNEDATAKLVRELKEEISKLRDKLQHADENDDQATQAQDNSVNALKDQLLTSEKLMKDLNETWEEKLKRTQIIVAERERLLEELGISMDEDNPVGVYGPKNTPHLMNLNEDPLMSECLLYHISPGNVIVGSSTESVGKQPVICLLGKNIAPQHAMFIRENNAVHLKPINDSLIFVNGVRIFCQTQLFTSDRIRFGEHHFYRFIYPGQGRRSRSDAQSGRLSVLSDTNVLDYLSNLDQPQSFSPVPSLNGSEYEDTSGGISRRSTTPSPLAYTGVDIFPQGLHDNISTTHRIILERQLQATKDEYEHKIKLISTLVPASQFASLSLSPLPMWTIRETHLAKIVVTRWKERRHLMDLLRTLVLNTPLLKEANILAQENDRKINYQWAIVDTRLYRPALSLWEYSSLGGLSRPQSPVIGTHLNATTFDKFPSMTETFSLAVRVYDNECNTSFIWSYQEFIRRLERMRAIALPGIPESQVESTNDVSLFTDQNYPWFERIGYAFTPLQCLYDRRPGKYRVPVICTHKLQILGYMHLRLRPIPASDGTSDTVSGNSDSYDNLDNMLVDIMILELDGISESHYTQVHVQFSSDALGSIGSTLYATEPISDFGNGTLPFLHSQIISISTDEENLRKLRYGCLPLEILGRRKLSNDVLMQDEIGTHQTKKSSDDAVRVYQPLHIEQPTGRLHTRSSYSELSSDSEFMPLQPQTTHILMMFVEIDEIEVNGSYAPVAVSQKRTPRLETPVFFLRQGLQRRVYITLKHHSSYDFAWKAVKEVRFSSPRLITATGEVVDELLNELPLKLFPSQSVIIDSFGRGTIEVQAQWDSSQFEYTHLDRISPAGHHVLLSMTVVLDVAQSKMPVILTTLFAIVILDRDQKAPRNSLGGLFNPVKMAARSVSFFDVTLTPNVSLRPAVHSYIRGEESLGHFRILGTPDEGSLLLSNAVEYRHYYKRMRDVSKRYFYTGDVKPTSADEELSSLQRDLIKRVLQLWVRPSPTRVIVYKERRAIVMEEQQYKQRTTYYRVSVQALALNTPTTKSGYLLTPEYDSNRWIKRWFVLRRPYLIIYRDSSENEAFAIIFLAHAHFSFGLHISHMLERPFSFAVYTKYYGHLLQAASEMDMMEWTAALDPLYVSAQRSRNGSTQASSSTLKPTLQRSSLASLKSLFKIE